MTTEELVASIKAAGFHYLTEPEILQLANDAYLVDICEEEDWPFLEALKEGKAPLEVKDLRTIEYVTNLTQETKLDPLRRARITDDFSPDLTTSGSPSVYYLTEGKKVNVYPVSTNDEFAVRYWKVPEELSGTKEPLLPPRFHSLIVDGARARGYELSDDFELATAARAVFDARFVRMVDSLMNMQHDAPEDHVVVEDAAAMR